MNLIIDNGGTKAIWVVANNSEIVQRFNTAGIYPHHAKDEEFSAYIEEAKKEIHHPVSKVFFYSTGSKLASQRDRINGLFAMAFGQEVQVEADTDLLAAARALCRTEPGIACILGTGSNSCLYDGNQILQNLGGLGFILGDEGSGAAIGKTLIKAYLDNFLPQELRTQMEERFGLTVENIIQNVYQNPGPNKYLATFARFAHDHRSHPFIAQILSEQFTKFFDLSVKVYPGYSDLPIHFLGSIANHFSEALKAAAGMAGVTIESFNQDPIPGLVQFHAKKNLPVK